MPGLSVPHHHVARPDVVGEDLAHLLKACPHETDRRPRASRILDRSELLADLPAVVAVRALDRQPGRFPIARGL